MNYTWSNNLKFASTGYGLWELRAKGPAGYSDIHVTMNFPKFTYSNKAWSWPHVTLIDNGGTTTHVYIKRGAEDKAVYVTKYGGSLTLSNSVKGICDKIVADFREYGIPCEYLGKDDWKRYIPGKGK